uniref:GxxExxY protein n=1 Tax=Eubacterium cellulosolvens TaxID=29322 RepID=UPI00068874D5|nr:GxxExxY protein [[Eubacterium] cellulosolvens]
MPEQKYDILRNIFCVAASRGKNQIIFVKHDEEMLSEQSLSTPNETNHNFKDMQISTMFDFKYKEDVEACYGLLDIKKVDRADMSVIKIENHEDLIDLAPCIGIYQEASFFEKYDIDKDLELYKLLNKDKTVDTTKYKTLDEKILYLTSLETSQNRYVRQVNRKVVEDEQCAKLKKRLLEVFTTQEDTQKISEIQFAKRTEGHLEFSAVGYADVIKNKIIYELKYVSELTHEHFLQCACYVVAQKLKKGILWNTRTNDMYEILIPDKEKFLDCVAKTITKHQLEKYYKPKASCIL